MNINVTKIALYVLLLGLILFCGKRFLGKYNALMSTEVNSARYEMDVIERPKRVPVTEEPVTNSVESGESVAGSPDLDEQPVEVIEEAATDSSVNIPSEPSSPNANPEPMTKMSMERGTPTDTKGIGLYVVSLFGLILGFGIMAAHDISTFMGRSTHKLFHNEEGEGVHSAAYDAAEEMWASGQHLEAIRMMREYLRKNPREVHVMIRIAEIYEKDLGNFLAAALEYQELLKMKLPKERWAWSAIHLVNLYFGKIDKPREGIELLYRIHREYGQTAAAAKARKRLLQLDPEFQNELDRWEADQAGAVTEEYEEEHENDEPDVQTLTDSDDSNSHLPKGFRTKK